MKLKFIIPGKPQGKERPRVVRNAQTGKIMTYTPKHTREYETLVKACFLEQCGREYMEGPIEAEICAFFPVPSKARKQERLEMEKGQYATVHLDVDNICKSCLDALNGLAYADDSQVVKISAEKRYSTEPRVEVLLKTLTEGEEKG